MRMLLWLSLAIIACSGSNKPDNGYFPTLQKCFDEHTSSEGLDTQMAIVTCCIDHPIGDSETDAVHPSCGMSKADCVAHVTDNLAAVSASDIDAACQTYIDQLAM
jgi:hypothetical protein